MSSTPSIDEQVTFSGGTSPQRCTTPWTRSQYSPVSRALSLSWTTPHVRHELVVAPEQGTAIDSAELQSLWTRALCHWLIDQLPFTAYQELLRALVDLRSYHAALSVEPQPPRLASAKPVKKVSRTTRPEVDLTGE